LKFEVQKVQKPNQSSQHPVDWAEKILKFELIFQLNHEELHRSTFTKVGAGYMIYNSYFWRFQTPVQNFSSLDQSNMPSRNWFGVLTLWSRAPAPGASRTLTVHCGCRVNFRITLGPTDAITRAMCATPALFSLSPKPSTRGEAIAGAQLSCATHRVPSPTPSPCCVLNKPTKP
jgi:hypothetical protein